MSYYRFLTEKRGDSLAFQQQVEAVTHQLTARLKGKDPKTGKRVGDKEELLTLREGPVLMVGQVQSGKTRAFLGVMAKCFDEGYDVAIIMTKGTRLLGMQTFERVKREFSSTTRGCKASPIGSKSMRVFDLEQLSKLVITPKLLKSKLVFVVIKEDNNLLRLRQVLNNHPALTALNTLLIDDEADHGTLSAGQGSAGVVQSVITEVRRSYNQRDRRGRSGVMTMLQVTATPVDLYFQRDASSEELDYISLQPDYAHLLAPHANYVGGEHYFEHSKKKKSVESYLWHEINFDEIETLKSPSDPQRLSSRNYKIVTSRLKEYKACFVSYLVAGTIRYLQTERRRAHPDAPFFEPSYSSAYIIHVSRVIEEHAWQKSCLEATLRYLMAEGNEDIFEAEVSAAYEDFKCSIRAAKKKELTELERAEIDLPRGGAKKIYRTLRKLLEEQDLQITVINSSSLNPESDVVPLDLLVEDGQLALTYTFNIFIGAQSIDRGITVDHLIAFYYGRSSSSNVQVDSMLQHARWYGARSPADLAVTRLHTPKFLYKRLQAVYEFDKALREDLEHTQGELKMIDQTSLLEHNTLSIVDTRRNPAVTYHKFETTSVMSFYCKGANIPQDDQKRIVRKLDRLLIQKLEHSLDQPGQFIASEVILHQIIELLDQMLTNSSPVPWNRKRWDVNALKANLDLCHDKQIQVSYQGQLTANFFDVMRSSSFLSRFKLQQLEMDSDASPILVLVRVLTHLDSKWGAEKALYVPLVLNSDRTSGARFIGVQDTPLKP